MNRVAPPRRLASFHVALATFLGPALAAAAAAQQAAPPRLLVLPITSKEVPPAAAQRVEQELAAALGRSGKYRVLAHDEVEALVRHQATGQSLGCDAAQEVCAAELGQSAGAERVLAASLGSVGGTLVLHATLLSPESATVVGRVSHTGESLDGVLAGIDDLVARLVGGGGEAVRAFTLRLPPGGVRAAVMPMASQGVEASVADNLTQVAAIELKRMQGFSVISQDDIVAMLQLEADKSALGCEDAACFAEIGGALGVDYLVIGNAGRLDDTFVVGLKLIDARRAEVLNRVAETFKGRASDLISAMRFAVYQLVGHTPTGGGVLSLRVQPADASIEVGGQAFDAEAPRDLQMTPGRAAVQIHADGYYSRYVETYVEPGAVSVLNVELTEIPVPWYRRWWIWTAAGVVVAGAVGAAVLATQLDSGPPANTGALELTIGRALR